MKKRISIDPITRLEGHGKIEIFLDDHGDVERTYLQVPDFKGFEKFCEGRAVEEMPVITPKICGVCPTAHHIASSKALDDLFGVDPPASAKKIRELMHNAFIFEDHLLHFFILGGPDLIVGPDAPGSERNLFGVIRKLGAEIGKRVIDIRKRVRAVNAALSGSPLYPVCGLPGGVSKSVTEKARAEIRTVAEHAVEFAKFTMQVFHDEVMKNQRCAALLQDEFLSHDTHYMGLVDDRGHTDFYDGRIKIVNPNGKEVALFEAKAYSDHLEERVEPWSYMKILFLKNVGWKGFVAGEESGVYRVGPLARLNVCEGLATSAAQAEYEKMFDALGGKPVHNTLAYHWARLIEVLYAAEKMEGLAADEELTNPEVRHLPEKTPEEGFGVCEAPRGTLFHHYQTDERGIVDKINLLVATQNNGAAICMSIEKAAKALIKGGHVTEGMLNMIEMAFRAYDPCLACATHCLEDEAPWIINLYDNERNLLRTIRK